jgi:simple sugar transport system permease protein
VNERTRRFALSVLSAVVALAAALVILAIVLTVLGVNPFEAVAALFNFGETPRAKSNQIRAWINRSIPLFLAGLAVSVGFRMNLFNIGVEGQYRVAALFAAWAGAAVTLPKPIHISYIIIVAMLSGAAYAAIPAVLKVTRGVNEVITTIMLNSIAIALTAWLVRGPAVRANLPDNTNPSTEPLPDSGRLPGFTWIFDMFGLEPPSRPVNGFLWVAIVIGVVVAVVLRSSRFGFSLRASGLNLTAAAASGIPARRMVVQAMLLSGALAGLIGLPQVLGEVYVFGDTFTAGLGFAGIAVALLGRNSPAGIAVAAILFAFLDRAGPSLQREGIPPSVVVITQGVIVLTVVIVNEVGTRMVKRSEERRAGGTQEAPPPSGTTPPPTSPSAEEVRA